MIKACAISFAVGLVVGVLYCLLRVRSPAPPLVALVGLLGILAGEQIVPKARTVLTRAASPAGRQAPQRSASTMPPTSGD